MICPQTIALRNKCPRHVRSTYHYYYCYHYYYYYYYYYCYYYCYCYCYCYPKSVKHIHTFKLT